MAGRSRPGLERLRKKVAHRRDQFFHNAEKHEDYRGELLKARGSQCAHLIELIDAELEALNDEQEDQDDRGE